MADPRLYDASVGAGYDAAIARLLDLAEDVPSATEPYAQQFGNPNLSGSPISLLQDVALDRHVRAEHGDKIITRAPVDVLDAHHREIAELQELRREVADLRELHLQDQVSAKPAKRSKAKT